MNVHGHATGHTDAHLMRFDMSGDLIEQKQISLGIADVFVADGSLIAYGNSFFWAGESTAIKTELQEENFSNSNGFIFKYQFDHPSSYDCIYEYSVSSRLVSTNYLTPYDESYVSMENTINIERREEVFLPYQSPYSGGFELKDTFVIPRPCAKSSVNMTEVSYYYGQRTFEYDITSQQGAFSAFQRMEQPLFLHQNGSEVGPWLATLDLEDMKVSVQTDDQNFVDTHRTWAEGCSAGNDLLMVNLYIDVLDNSAPSFVGGLQTTFRMDPGDKRNGAIPYYEDDEGHGVIAYLNSVPGFEFPDFITFDNRTEKYVIFPEDESYSGKTYRFNVVLQEENSDVMVTSETVRIIMSGQDTTTITERVKTELIIDVARDSTGFLNFSTDVNTTWVYENWKEKLSYWGKDTTQETFNLTEFELHEPISLRSIPFTCKFDRPYLLGLLNKKRDYLIFELEDAEMIILDTTTEELKSNTASGSIPMQFDMRNKRMKDLRKMAEVLYWVGLGVVFIQFFALLYRDVTLLPLWTLIEYMQLVAFMPLYNFKLIPYLYDAFKPFLISHMILFDSFTLYKEFQYDYFNVNYLNYNLSINKLLQSLINITFLACAVFLVNIVLLVMSKALGGKGSTGEWVDKKLKQFRFNVYIRFYMLAFFDLTFFSAMKIWEGNNSTSMRKIALVFSYFFLVIGIIAPISFFALVMRKFKDLKTKELKASYNALVLKIDKNKRWRVANVGFFFGRRMAIAILLCLPVTNKYIFLQYVFVLMTSHIQILYLVAVKPYQSPMINIFVLCNETFYSTLVIMVFIFSDATP